MIAEKRDAQLNTTLIFHYLMTHSQLEERVDALGSEVTEIRKDLSGSFLQNLHSTELPEPLPEGVRSVQTHAKSFGESLKFHMYHVASDYYDWTLEKRAYESLWWSLRLVELIKINPQTHSQGSNHQSSLQKHSIREHEIYSLWRVFRSSWSSELAILPRCGSIHWQDQLAETKQLCSTWAWRWKTGTQKI